MSPQTKVCSLFELIATAKLLASDISFREPPKKSWGTCYGFKVASQT